LPANLIFKSKRSEFAFDHKIRLGYTNKQKGESKEEINEYKQINSSVRKVYK